MASRSNNMPGDSSSDIKFEGMLEKQGKLTGSFLGKKYWCLLDEHRLSYYKSADKNGPCSGFIEVSRVHSVRKTSKGHGFDVLTHSGSQTFLASSAEIQDQWVKALRDAMGVAGRRRDSLRMSVVGDACMSVYEANSDDDASNDVSVPTPNSASDLEQTRSTPSVGDKDSAVNGDSASVTNVTFVTADESSDPADGDEVGAAKFKYMNAADVAEALQSGGGGDGGVFRVKSIDSEDEETDHETLPATNSRNNTSSSPPHSKAALPAADVLSDSTADVIPPSPEMKSDVVQKQEQNSEVEKKSGESPKSSPVPQLNVVASEHRREAAPGTVAAVVKNPAVQVADESTADGKKAPPQRNVVRRRASQQQSAVEQTKIAAVFELHIDTDFKPTVFSDVDLDHLAAGSGSAVEKLKQFLENDQCSSQHIPTAVQPGKAFDSLKYFLSTLD